MADTVWIRYFDNFDKAGAIGYAPGITKYSFLTALDNMKLKMSLENKLTWTPYLVGEDKKASCA